MIVKKLHDVPFAPTTVRRCEEAGGALALMTGRTVSCCATSDFAPGGSSPHHAHDWSHLVRVGRRIRC